MVSFLLAGGFWLVSLGLGAKILKVQLRALPQLPLTSLLYLLPFPWLLWVHGLSPEGPSWLALREAILIRKGLYWQVDGIEGPLNLIFFVLGLFVSFWQFTLIRKDLGQGVGRTVILFALASATALLMTSLAATLAYAVLF